MSGQPPKDPKEQRKSKRLAAKAKPKRGRAEGESGSDSDMDTTAETGGSRGTDSRAASNLKHLRIASTDSGRAAPPRNPRLMSRNAAATLSGFGESKSGPAQTNKTRPRRTLPPIAPARRRPSEAPFRPASAPVAVPATAAPTTAATPALLTTTQVLLNGANIGISALTFLTRLNQIIWAHEYLAVRKNTDQEDYYYNPELGELLVNIITWLKNPSDNAPLAAAFTKAFELANSPELAAHKGKVKCNDGSKEWKPLSEEEEVAQIMTFLTQIKSRSDTKKIFEHACQRQVSHYQDYLRYINEKFPGWAATKGISPEQITAALAESLSLDGEIGVAIHQSKIPGLNRLFNTFEYFKEVRGNLRIPERTGDDIPTQMNADIAACCQRIYAAQVHAGIKIGETATANQIGTFAAIVVINLFNQTRSNRVGADGSHRDFKPFMEAFAKQALPSWITKPLRPMPVTAVTFADINPDEAPPADSGAGAGAGAGASHPPV